MDCFALLCALLALSLASAHSHGHGHGHEKANKDHHRPERPKFQHGPVQAPFDHKEAEPTKPMRSHFLYEDLGKVIDLNATEVMNFVLSSEKVVSHFHMEGVTLAFRKSHSYKDVVTTFRFDQFLHGLPVYGGDLAVHIFQSSRLVHGVTGNIISTSEVPVPSAAVNLSPEIIEKLASRHGHFGVKVTEKPSLLYVIDDADVGRLCFHIRVLSHKTIGWNGRATLPSPLTLASFPTPTEPYDVYIDAITHEVVMDVSVYQRALYRHVFDVQHGKTLPGELVRKEGDPPVSDANVNQAYDNAGRCYTFYWNIFGRDSWDNEGSPLNSSVHYEVNYDNAFWNGEQMVYGDGDGVIFANFTNDQTVICHELTHAVTQSTSQLRYWYESGSLNEAFSDIMGSSSYVYTTDPVFDRPDPETSWILGPNVTLVNLNPAGCPDCPPGTRYMNNPPLDGASRDYYPDRYTGFEDDRGVHWNSGIANLAYVLTVQGGAHPQEKTDVYVEPIGIINAQQIYYLGFTQYLTATSVYVDARAATQKAAQVLYPTSTPIYDSVGNAWSAVGVDAA